MNCLNPILVRNKFGVPTISKCGQCMPCRVNKTKETSMRLLHELRYWNDAIFLTLTYDDEHLPTTACGKSYLDYEDLKNFWKRLRDRLEGRKIKYYAVGEYGEESHRAHFHAIVFGLSHSDKSVIENSWKNGFIKIGTVTSMSCDYVAGYVQKKLTGIDKINKISCLPPEKSFSSGGLGLRYALEHKEQFIKHGITVNGKRVGIPRYYKDKIGSLQGACDVKADIYHKSEKYKNDFYNLMFNRDEYFRLRDSQLNESKARLNAHRSKKI